jgi:hypothetical protein
VIVKTPALSGRALIDHLLAELGVLGICRPHQPAQLIDIVDGNLAGSVALVLELFAAVAQPGRASIELLFVQPAHFQMIRSRRRSTTPHVERVHLRLEDDAPVLVDRHVAIRAAVLLLR